jgi:hypothetical protein
MWPHSHFPVAQGMLTLAVILWHVDMLRGDCRAAVTRQQSVNNKRTLFSETSLPISYRRYELGSVGQLARRVGSWSEMTASLVESVVK